MSTVKISALPSAVGIDATADVIPIVQSATTNKINRNTFLGITSAPAGISDTQNVAMKTLDNTNAITIKDGSFTLNNTADTTKVGVFSLAGNTTGTTRTYTMPNASVTLASLTGTETLTNKTITSPTITGGTIDNTTITVDSISGHTSATIVTVANLQISNGVLNSANAVTAVSVAASAIQPQALFTGTGTGWSWSSWTPTLTNMTLGNGTVTAKYIQIGKTVTARFRFLLGSTSAIGTSPTITLPVTSADVSTLGILGNGFGTSNATAYYLSARRDSSTTSQLVAWNSAGTYLTTTGITASVPNTWTTNDYIDIYMFYEAA